MSIRHMTAVWDDPYYQGTDKTKLLIALALADFAGENGEAWPAVDTLARKARSSIRGAQEALQELKADGKVSITERAGPNFTNLYRLLKAGTPATIASPQPLHPRSEAQIPPQPSVASLRVNRQEPSKEEPPKGGVDVIFSALCRIRRFNLGATPIHQLGYDLMHLISDARATDQELEALVQFYNKPDDSKYPEALARKRTASNLMREFREQIALALKVCPPKKERPEKSANSAKPAPPTEPEQPPDPEKIKAAREKLRQHIAAIPDQAPMKPQGGIGRHKRERLAHPKAEFVPWKENVPCGTS